jgi:hypothetical protein
MGKTRVYELRIHWTQWMVGVNYVGAPLLDEPMLGFFLGPISFFITFLKEPWVN